MDGNVISAFLTMSIIVAILGGMLYFLKKTALKKNIKDHSIDMKILSRMSLNAKNHLFVVQAGEKRLLLGVSETGIRNLTEIDSENKIAPSINIPEIKQHNSLKNNNKNLSFTSFLKSTFSVVKN